MSLETIIEKINLEAQNKRDSILNESTLRAEKIVAEAEMVGKKQAESLVTSARQEAELEAHRLVTQTRLENKLKLLSVKKQLIDEVLDRAFQAENISSAMLKRKLILKDGEQEESIEKIRLKNELRPKVESLIAGVLKI